MRAKGLITTSSNRASGTAMRLRRSPRSGWSVSSVLVILAGALTLLAVWGPAHGWGNSGRPRLPGIEVSKPNTSVERPTDQASARGRDIASVSAELDELSFGGSTLDAAAFLTASVVLSLVFLHWISVVRARHPDPGIIFLLLVPG